MKKKLFGIFDRRPMIWFHYFLLTLILFGGFYIGERFIHLSSQSSFWMYVFWFIVVSVGDQLIHRILGVD